MEYITIQIKHTDKNKDRINRYIKSMDSKDIIAVDYLYCICVSYYFDTRQVPEGIWKFEFHIVDSYE